MCTVSTINIDVDMCVCANSYNVGMSGLAEIHIEGYKPDGGN